MDITDIIGKGKIFEPPFSVGLGCHIYDNQRRKVLEPVFSHFAVRRIFPFKDFQEAADTAIIIANHIVELLNEHWKDETR